MIWKINSNTRIMLHILSSYMKFNYLFRILRLITPSKCTIMNLVNSNSRCRFSMHYITDGTRTNISINRLSSRFHKETTNWRAFVRERTLWSNFMEFCKRNPRASITCQPTFWIFTLRVFVHVNVGRWSIDKKTFSRVFRVVWTTYALSAK